jgi:hypothetical protein
MHSTHETLGIETVTETVVILMIEGTRVILKKMPLKDM